MLAQRFPELSIAAVDVSLAAFELTRNNFNTSPFAQQLEAIQADVTSFEAEKKFDLIVSNPPYFNQSTLSNTLANARHTQSLSHDDLVKSCIKNIATDGSIWVVLPPNEMQNLETLFEVHGFLPKKRIAIHTRPEMSITRKIVCFSKADAPASENQLVYIRNESHEFSSTYIELTRAFHPFF